MELRELRAFVAVARELHFARAAEQLYMSPSRMSELIRQLESELGTSLLHRTTRKVTLTDAGNELLKRADAILGLVEEAPRAVSAVGRARAGHIKLGITPPAGPVLTPHLTQHFLTSRPQVSVAVERMWLTDLEPALLGGVIDVAVTCGAPGIDRAELTTVEVGSEPLLVGLRPGDRLAGQPNVDLHQLEERTLGLHPARLFPAMHAAERRLLADAHLRPPIRELTGTDLTASRWLDEPEVEWIMLIGSLLAGHEHTVVLPAPHQAIPFTLSWRSRPAGRPVVAHFVASSLNAPPPEGWLPARTSPAM